MARAIQPSPREIELRARTVHESQHILIELHCLFELPRRHIVMVEHTDAYFHRASPRVYLLQSILRNVAVDEQAAPGHVAEAAIPFEALLTRPAAEQFTARAERDALAASPLLVIMPAVAVLAAAFEWATCGAQR